MVTVKWIPVKYVEEPSLDFGRGSGFAKQQMEMMLRGVYLHPNGQIPAYEWNFGDVNPRSLDGRPPGIRRSVRNDRCFGPDVLM
jgi:hypothetical protein